MVDVGPAFSHLSTLTVLDLYHPIVDPPLTVHLDRLPPSLRILSLQNARAVNARAAGQLRNLDTLALYAGRSGRTSGRDVCAGVARAIYLMDPTPSYGHT